MFLDTAVAFLRRWGWFILPAILALAVLWYRHEAQSWERAFVAQKASYEAAQALAKARQAEKDRATADTFKSIAERVEYASREYEGAFRAAADSYAGRMRIKASQGGGCGPVAPGVHPDPGAPDGGQADADMVALSREDFDRLTGQAMQNAERGAFLTALIDEGLAVVEPGF
jgi:hypothetical protein